MYTISTGNIPVALARYCPESVCNVLVAVFAYLKYLPHLCVHVLVFDLGLWQKKGSLSLNGCTVLALFAFKTSRMRLLSYSLA